MSLEIIKLVGYWNKDLQNPEITFKVPENPDDKELVVVSLTRVDSTVNLDHLNVENTLKGITKKIKKELRNLDIIGRRLK